jgi:hypothetical protein
MNARWTHPPVEMRIGNSEGDYTLVYLVPVGDCGEERLGFFRTDDLEIARERLFSIIEEGGAGQIYNKDGSLI